MTKFCKFETLSMTLLILLIAYLSIGGAQVINQQYNYLQFSKYVFYFGVVALILYIYKKIKIKEKPKAKDYFMILLLFFGFLSYCYALDPTIALNGTLGRNEGLKTLFTYYSIFLLSSTLPQKNQKKVLNFFLITGILQILIGIIQILGITSILGYSRVNNFSTNFSFASGTQGNPNFYSTYILLCLLYSYGSFLKEEDKKKKLKKLALVIIFAFGLLLGNTLSCILGSILVIGITFIKKLNKQNIKSILKVGLIAIPILVASMLLINSLTNNRIGKTLQNNIEEVKEIFKYGITDKTGNKRIYIWKETLKQVPNYLMTGIGIDNFSLINNGSYLCSIVNKRVECFDKVHNEYLQILITEGIFTLTTYLAFIFYTIRLYFKKEKYKNKISYALFLAFIGYLIQAITNISVIVVAPIFYMIIGFLHKEEEIEEKPKKKKKSLK